MGCISCWCSIFWLSIHLLLPWKEWQGLEDFCCDIQKFEDIDGKLVNGLQDIGERKVYQEVL